MEFSEAFLHAFNHAMIYEVGAFWNPEDPEVQAGLIATSAQRKKVGYVNIPADTGGETKYGIAQRPNPEINVRGLDLAQAMEVYHRKYWLSGKCDLLPYNVAVIHFDGCVNHGVGRACKFLQRSVGAVEDGVIGNMTIAAVNEKAPDAVIESISSTRTDFYNAIVQRNASQGIFLKGWLRRISEVTDYSLNID